MRHDIYWMLPGDGRTYRALPKKQIDGQPIPTTWAGVGPAKAKELGAVECRRDVIPPYHSIPDGVDPWTTEDVDGVRVYSLDVSKLVHDEAAETAALADRVRAERDGRLRECDPQALPDFPHADDAAKQAWLDYRQALRDVPDQEGFPAAVAWPEAPA